MSGSTDNESLRADVWKTNHPESARTYRSEERRDVAVRRRLTRTQRRLANLKNKTQGETAFCHTPPLSRGNDSMDGMVVEYGYNSLNAQREAAEAYVAKRLGEDVLPRQLHRRRSGGVIMTTEYSLVPRIALSLLIHF